MSQTPEPDYGGATSEQKIFLAALEIRDASERKAFLKSACGEDMRLYRGVESLLNEQETAGSFLETPAVSFSRDTTKPDGPDRHGTRAPDRPAERPGDKIGRYKLLQSIGEGGCGAVYMAEQQEPVRRRVALKIIKLGMDTRQVIARFEAERQALAMMDHPNIAKVLDAGATDQGRPFFVMELVRGIRITDYADQNQLSTKDRLKLFIQVCNAIQHAHQKGIVHRDIKPSNILVTLHDGTPVPKVIDFGVAKATNQQRLTDKTLFTAFDQFIGTPAYMSPEQAEMSGLDIDTRTDVYSLGVLLYELLTGKTPFDPDRLMRGGLDECRRTLRLEEPDKPSNRLATMIEADLTTVASRRGTEPPRLVTLLRGDLDWVVMKCLEKDRTRRYATVNALAMDAQRYLDGEPVFARPPSGLYRFQKFARRHQAPLVAGVAILLMFIGASAVSIWQAIRATQAERDAHNAQVAEANLRRQAETGWDRARDQTRLARLNEYVADMNLAQQSLTAGNYGRAVQLLQKHSRTNNVVPDFRGFEWRYLWNVSQGDNHTSLPDQGGPVLSVAFSANADLLASALFEKVNIYDPRTRNLIATLPKGAMSLAFSPDGRRLYAGSTAAVRVWDTVNWTEIRQIDEHFGPLALSADGSRIAACGRSGVRIWNTTDWREIGLLEKVCGPLAFSPDGKRLAGDTDQGITIYDIATGQPGPVLQDSTNLFPRMGPKFRDDRLAGFSLDGELFAAPRNQQSSKGVFVVSLWDAETGKELAVMPEDPEHIEHTGVISSLAFSQDGSSLATGSRDHSIRIWDLASRKPRRVIQGHLHEVWSIAMTADGQMLASGARDGGLRLWNTREQEKEEALSGSYVPLGFSPDSRYLLALAGNDTAVFINLTTHEPEREFPLSPVRRRPPGSISTSADQKLLAEGLEDGSVKLWNTVSRESTTLKVTDRMLGLALLSPDGNALFTGGFGHGSKLWDLRKGDDVALGAQGHRAWFSPDGKTLVVIDRDDSVAIWDVPTRTLRTNLVMDPAPGFSAAFSPDGRILAITSGFSSVEDEIRLWDIARGRLLGTCIGHKQGVFSLAFSPDGRTLASASDDSTVKLWNVATRQELLSIRRLGGGLNSLMFSPDGRWLVGARGFPRQTAELRFHFAPTLAEIETAREAAP